MIVLVKLLILAVLLTGCANQTALFKKYQVLSGDSLHSIARRYKLDHRELARLNQLAPPYDLQIGQSLYINNAPTQQGTKRPAKIWHYSGLMQPTQPRLMNWIWPAKSHVIKVLSEDQSPTNGIDISNTTYSVAAATGKVIYAGTSIRGYGNLVILRHGDDYISAYSSPQTIIVVEEERVQRGRRLMRADRRDKKQNSSVLHFEIHYLGKPLDPRKYLPAKRKPSNSQFNRL